MPERDYSKLGKREGPPARSSMQRVNKFVSKVSWHETGLVQCTYSLLVQVTEGWSGAQGPGSIFCSCTLAGLHKINGPSRFHLQPENGQSVRIQVSAKSNIQPMIHRKPEEDKSQIEEAGRIYQGPVWTLTATRRQITRSQMCFVLTVLSAPTALPLLPELGARVLQPWPAGDFEKVA